MTNLGVYNSIVIPSLRKDGETINIQNRLDALNRSKAFFASHLGGYSAFNGEGGYILNGLLVEEAITRIDGYGDLNLEDFKYMALEIGMSLSQEAMFIVYRGSAMLVEMPKPLEVVKDPVKFFDEDWMTAIGG